MRGSPQPSDPQTRPLPSAPSAPLYPQPRRGGHRKRKCSAVVRSAPWEMESAGGTRYLMLGGSGTGKLRIGWVHDDGG